jgi:hypothetical protein
MSCYYIVIAAGQQRNGKLGNQKLNAQHRLTWELVYILRWHTWVFPNQWFPASYRAELPAVDECVYAALVYLVPFQGFFFLLFSLALKKTFHSSSIIIIAPPFCFLSDYTHFRPSGNFVKKRKYSTVSNDQFFLQTVAILMFQLMCKTSKCVKITTQ